MNGVTPLSLFISYSHKDDEWRAKLDSHLALLKRQSVFDVWHDRRIGAGREWAGEINAALERASVVLLLVSADFLASDYCYDKEMKRALQRHDQGDARVVPVILRTCDWQSSDFGKLQAVPRDGRPIASHSDVDAAMTEVALALRRIAEEMRVVDAASTPAQRDSGAVPPPAVLRTAQDLQLPAHSSTSQSEAAPWIDAAPEPSTAAPDIRPRRKVKIGAVKLWFLEFGPFELEWPPDLRPTRVLAWLAVAVVVVAAFPYLFVLKPRLDEARDFMRRAEYVSAAKTLESLPQWAAALPLATGLTAQAEFGSRLSRGEHIRALAPELDSLGKRYPNAPDVLVFMGLKSYYVDANVEQAIKQFTQAAERDAAHVEAHFLGAGRHMELAYAALGQGDERKAKAAANDARKLMDRAVSRSAFAETLPRYASQIAELRELEGDERGAYEGYARLANLHALSALQSAMVSWRLPQADAALQRGLEDVEGTISRIKKEPADADAGAVEGWSFRVGPRPLDVVAIRLKSDKLCLLEWAQEISKSLLSAPNIGTPNAIGLGNTSTLLAALVRCGNNAAAQPIREIVCVQAATALDRLQRGEQNREALEDWRINHLHCSAGLRPLPTLPVPGASTKPTVLRSRPGDDHHVEST